MVFDINDYTYTQNNNKFYVGDITTEENLKFKCDYIVIGNIKTNGILLAMENLIVIGNIEAESVFINKDLFCTGSVISKSIDIDGEKVVLEQIENILPDDLAVESELSIKELIYRNIKHYGYSRNIIKVNKINDSKYYVDLDIKENDINSIFIGYINQLLKSINNEFKHIKIYMKLNDNIQI